MISYSSYMEVGYMARGKVAPKKNVYAEIKNKIIEYLESNPEIYSPWEGGDVSDITVLKKLFKNVLIINDNNQFMIHKKCNEEEFIVPVFINIMGEKKSENQKILKDFGCHFVRINSIYDIERKLGSI